jgi:hypothetical protein
MKKTVPKYCRKCGGRCSCMSSTTPTAGAAGGPGDTPEKLLALLHDTTARVLASANMTVGTPGGARVYMAPTVAVDSWLNEERFAWFRQAYGYAATQSNAIPALAKLTPEDTYYLYAALHYGDDRDAPTDAGRLGVLTAELHAAQTIIGNLRAVLQRCEIPHRDTCSSMGSRGRVECDCPAGSHNERIDAALSGTPAVSTQPVTPTGDGNRVRELLEQAYAAIFADRCNGDVKVHGHWMVRDHFLAEIRTALAADSGAARQEAPAAAPGGERDPLHPNGDCTCSGEGCCAWCLATLNDELVGHHPPDRHRRPRRPGG